MVVGVSVGVDVYVTVIVGVLVGVRTGEAVQVKVAVGETVLDGNGVTVGVP